jgi:alpha-1,2-mannosyltransferase
VTEVVSKKQVRKYVSRQGHTPGAYPPANSLTHSLTHSLTRTAFQPNLSRSELHEWYGRAAAGVHTMWNEHFGIGVVEMMAAGVPAIAHDSGGPALDIVGRRSMLGLLATSAQQYADAMAALLLEPHAEPRRRAMATAARASVQERFSEAAFSDAFCASLAPALA